jgi:hypothetical protein
MQLGHFKDGLLKNNEVEIAAFREELKALSTYELELLKSKLKNTQPSYPKKLEASQKLAVLLNSIGSHPGLSFGEWKTRLQQYLVSYAGIISAETEALVTSAIAGCDAGDADSVLQSLSSAKAALKEGVSAGVKL